MPLIFKRHSEKKENLNKQLQILYTILSCYFIALKWDEVKLQRRKEILTQGQGPGIWGTWTGRPSSTPILALDRQWREILHPHKWSYICPVLSCPLFFPLLSFFLTPTLEAAVQDASLEGSETPEQLPQNLLINSAHTQRNQATSAGSSTVARFIWSCGCLTGY